MAKASDQTSDDWGEAANHMMDEIANTGRRPTWPELVAAIQSRATWEVYSFDRNILDRLTADEYSPRRLARTRAPPTKRSADKMRGARISELAAEWPELFEDLLEKSLVSIRFVYDDELDVSTDLKCYRALKRHKIQCLATYTDLDEEVDLRLDARTFNPGSGCCMWLPIDLQKFPDLGPTTLVGFRGDFVFA